jgi:hypothetical protein
MRNNTGLSLIVVLLASFSAANAQTVSPAGTVTKFDGTYDFVSATKLNESFRNYVGRLERCADYKGTPLTIVNGQVRFFTWTGTVGPQGELTMHVTLAPFKGPVIQDRTITGEIDNTGTIHARCSTRYCQYDVIWRKADRRKSVLLWMVHPNVACITPEAENRAL